MNHNKLSETVHPPPLKDVKDVKNVKDVEIVELTQSLYKDVKETQKAEKAEESQKAEEAKNDRKKQKKKRIKDKKDGIVFVVYVVRLDDACLKKSQIQIIGVFDNESRANHQRDQAQKEIRDSFADIDFGYDGRCDYASVAETKLNDDFFFLLE
jgi:mRNA degradation ribonuclease J1/J2